MNTLYLRMRVWSFYPDNHYRTNLSASRKSFKKLHYNPMLNYVILENVFSYIETKHLRKLRLVCKMWNEESTRILKKQPDYQTIKNENEVLKFMHVCGNTFPQQSFHLIIPQFSKTYINLFDSVKAQNLLVNLKIAVRSNDFPILLKSVTSLINLESFILFRIPEDLESIFVTSDCYISPMMISNFSYKNKLPKLKTVHFKNINTRKRFLCNYSRFIVLFLKCADNLEHLEFGHWSNSLMEIFRISRLPNLTTLIVQGRGLGNSELTWLSMKKYERLTNLEVSVDGYASQEVLDKLKKIYSGPDKCFRII